MVDLINLATPIAHETTGNYEKYYPTVAPLRCAFEVSKYFDRSGCKGMRLRKSSGLIVPLSSAIHGPLFNLYAPTDGYITYQNKSLYFRLATELQGSLFKKYCSAALLRQLSPNGPQLRHVVYSFQTTIDPFATAIKPTIAALLANANHPMRSMTNVKEAQVTSKLGAYLDTSIANRNTWVAGFQGGAQNLFVKAGDIIGNFFDYEVEIQFRDSCGGSSSSTLDQPTGRAINPSYYFYLLYRDVTQRNPLTQINPVADTSSSAAHPMLHLYRRLATFDATVVNADQFLDFSAAHPPKPTLPTVIANGADNTPLADSAIGFGTLGQWHKSRNVSSEAETKAPVRWRYYGNDAADTNAALYGMLVTQQVPNTSSDLLPGGANFDFNLTPALTGDDRVTKYWNLYYSIYNAVATAFQIPCEILVTISCTETGSWFDQQQDTDVIRMEPLAVGVSVPAGSPLEQYKAIAGQNVKQNGVTIYGPGGNALLPRPWSNEGHVHGSKGLKWNDLRDLIGAVKSKVSVSPGITQVLVTTGLDAFKYVRGIYSSDFLRNIAVTAKSDAASPVQLHVDDPPTAAAALFQQWFGVTLDSAGNPAQDLASVDQNLTRLKRALHGIVGCAAVIKRNYNYALTKGNFITDFDAPTVFSGYNAGAVTLSKGSLATVGASSDMKWTKLYGVAYHDKNYPDSGSHSYNRVVKYFNDRGYAQATPPAARPAVRQWRES